jgi:CRISPR-associated protein Cst2
MSLHLFANIVTPFGTAANNRAETDGNITTLQKLIWMGQSHSTVSAEAIRFALRRLLAEEEPTNRVWNEAAQPKPRNEWKDDQFSGWTTTDGAVFIDDDLLGFMSAQAAKEDASDVDDSAGQEKKSKSKPKGTVNLRRGLLEITRAISLTPWAGDVTFNANTPWSNLGAKDKDNPGPYGTEVHATRYQFGLALTPERLRDKSRAAKAINAIGALGTVAGNHGRFLYDFSPDSIVIRLTDDPAPRLLYCFETADDGKTVKVADSFTARVGGIDADINAKELILGGTFAATQTAEELESKGATRFPNGVKAAVAEAVSRINSQLKIKG